MSVSPVSNNVYNYAPKGHQQHPDGKEQLPARRENIEYTTVTTHCDEQHWHDRSCPHTTYTQSAPKNGQYGAALDMLV